MRARCHPDVARRKVRVALFGHPRVRVTQLVGDDAPIGTLRIASVEPWVCLNT